MLSPVGIVYNKVEDRETGQQQNRRPKKARKKEKQPEVPSSAKKGDGDHIDLTA